MASLRAEGWGPITEVGGRTDGVENKLSPQALARLGVPVRYPSPVARISGGFWIRWPVGVLALVDLARLLVGSNVTTVSLPAEVRDTLLEQLDALARLSAPMTLRVDALEAAGIEIDEDDRAMAAGLRIHERV